MGTQAAFVSGALLGFVFFIAFSAYALALWYGSVRIIAGSMDGGDVVTVRFDALHTLRDVIGQEQERKMPSCTKHIALLLRPSTRLKFDHSRTCRAEHVLDSPRPLLCRSSCI